MYEEKMSYEETYEASSEEEARELFFAALSNNMLEFKSGEVLQFDATEVKSFIPNYHGD